MSDKGCVLLCVLNLWHFLLRNISTFCLFMLLRPLSNVCIVHQAAEEGRDLGPDVQFLL